MKTAYVRRAAAACIACLAAGFLLAWMVPLGAKASNVLTACVNPGNGGLRLVADTVACHANETRVQWNVEGPAGPAGPTGPAGPAGEDGGASGPPFVWICTPASYPNTSGQSRSDIYVYNASLSTANVAVHILDRDGANLAGVTVPGSNPPKTYPGQTGIDTVPVLPEHTFSLNWVQPDTFTDPTTNVSFTVRVTSSEQVVVSSNFSFSGPVPVPCTLVRP